MRFEHLSSHYYDYIDGANGISRQYDQLFPSAGISYNGNKWRHSLTFRTTTARPSFSALSSATYYVNRFFYQMGNPQLKHQNSYLVEWRTQWKDFFFSARYTRTNDFISNYFGATATKPYSVVSTYGNYDNISNLLASLYWSHTYGVWQPELNGAFVNQFFSVSYMGKPLSCDGNTWNVSFSNTFRITDTFNATLNYFFSNGGQAGYVKLKPYQYFSAGLTKTFLDRRLTIAFRAFDIFHQYLFRERGRIGVVDFTQTEDYRSWNYSLTVTFRLNSNKGKYNGQNSAKEMINRL